MEFTEDAVMEERTISSFTERELINPYPNQTPEAMLGRPIKVEDMPFGTTVLRNLVSWWEIRNVKTLDTFAWYRCDFRVRLLLRSSATAYGWVMAAWKYGEAKSDPALAEPFYMSTMDSAFMDVSSSTATEFDIPFIHPAPYFVKGSAHKDDYIELWLYKPTALADISTGSSTVDVEIWLEAYNIDVGGYVLPQSVVIPHSSKMPSTPGTTGFIQNIATAVNTAATVASAVGSMATLHQESQPLKAGSQPVNSLRTTQDGVPEENAAGGVKIAMFGNLNSIGGAPQIPSLCEFHPRDIATHTSRTLLSKVTQTPSLIWAENFAIQNQTIDIPLRCFGSYGHLVANYFRYYRGTHRLGLHFYTHPLLSARFTVQIFYADIAVDENVTTIPTMNFLIKGSETKMLDVPFHKNIAVLPTYPTTAGTVATVRIKMMREPSAFATGVTPYVFLAASLSSTEDAQFFSVRAAPGNDLPVVIPQSLRSMHATQGETLVSASTSPVPWYPEITTVEELCQRWFAREIRDEASNSARFDIIPYALVPALTVSSADLPYGTPYDVFASIFALSRSSMEFKVSLDPSKTGTLGPTAFVAMTNGTPLSYGVRNAFDPANGAHYTNVGQQSIVEYRAPFLSPYRALNWGVLNEYPLSNVNAVEGVSQNFEEFKTTSGQQMLVFARACEDLQFTYINSGHLNFQKPGPI